MALWILSGTTQVSQYQKKHSPTHTYPLSASSIYYDPWYPPCSIYVPDSLFPQFLSKFSRSTYWPDTLHFILHTFLHQIIAVSFHNKTQYLYNIRILTVH